MTAPQPPHAPVLRRHRLEALLTEFPDCDKFGFSVETERWLEYGGTLFPCGNRIAQLAAAQQLGVAERAVVEAAVALVVAYHEDGDRSRDSDELLAAVNALLALRAAAGKPDAG